VAIDVRTEIEVGRPRDEVAAYALDFDNATEWYSDIDSVRWETPKPLSVGSRAEFSARFLGRRLAYVYEVKALVPGQRLVMATTDDGPFEMETTYAWEDAAVGATRMVLRNRGGPSGVAGLASPLMAIAVRRANRQDLRRLKEILEGRKPG